MRRQEGRRQERRSQWDRRRRRRRWREKARGVGLQALPLKGAWRWKGGGRDGGSLADHWRGRRMGPAPTRSMSRHIHLLHRQMEHSSLLTQR